MSYLYVAVALTWILFIGFGMISVGTLRGAVEENNYELLLPKTIDHLISFLFLTFIIWIICIIVHLVHKLKERLQVN